MWNIKFGAMFDYYDCMLAKTIHEWHHFQNVHQRIFVWEKIWIIGITLNF